MPAQWTGKLIGEIHNAGFTIKAVAHQAKLHEKYVSQLLNADREAPVAEEKLRRALDELIKEKEEDNERLA
jgi:hypothetical protein